VQRRAMSRGAACHVDACTLDALQYALHCNAVALPHSTVWHRTASQRIAPHLV